jgi:glycolate oxidase iron-sulfur subunit
MDWLAAGRLEEDGGIQALEECVGCLACQARCPAGVPYGEMLDQSHARLAQDAGRGLISGPLRSWALRSLLPYPSRLARLRLPLQVLRALGLIALSGKLRLHRLPHLWWMAGAAWLPRRMSSGRRPPDARPGATYLFFPGCVGGLFFPAEERSARAILDVLGGYDLAGGSVCCGAVHRHLGLLDDANELARRNIAAYEAKPGWVVTHSAGCGAALKEYGAWLAGDSRWSERARRFSERVRDLSEILAESVDQGRWRIKARAARPRRVVYDDPCHALHAQGLGIGPRRLIDVLPGVRRVELPHAERCCGAGGTYFMRQMKLSREMIQGRMRDLASTEVTMLLTANPGCRLQWESALREAGRDVAVRHPAELWAEALADGSISLKESARNPL